MKNRLIINPTYEEIFDAEFLYHINNSIMHFEKKDLHQMVGDVVMILEGKGNGCNRIADAISDAMSYKAEIAKEYDDVSANKLLIMLSNSHEHPLVVSELEAVSEFVDDLTPPIEISLGMSEDANCQDDTATAILIFSSGSLDDVNS